MVTKYKQNETSQELSMGTKILKNKLLYCFKSIFVKENKKFDASATLSLKIIYSIITTYQI